MYFSDLININLLDLLNRNIFNSNHSMERNIIFQPNPNFLDEKNRSILLHFHQI